MEDYYEDLLSQIAMLNRRVSSLKAENQSLKTIDLQSENRRLRKKVKKLERRLENRPTDQLLDQAQCKALEEENELLKQKVKDAEFAIKVLNNNFHEMLRVHGKMMAHPKLKEYVQDVLGMKNIL